MNSQQVALRHACRVLQPNNLVFLYPPLTRSYHASLPRKALTDRISRFLGKKDLSSQESTSVSATSQSSTPKGRRKGNAQAAEQLEEPALVQGSLASNSVWGAVAPSATPSATPSPAKKALEVGLEGRNQQNMAFALDPRPKARRLWQRKMIIRHIRRRGRPTKEMEIARTEKTHLSKSHFFKTSMKKLAPLARQIAGKSLDEAILQMRFSGKKVAKDVKEHLLQARYEAITSRGMGLSPTSSEEIDRRLTKDPSQTPPLAHETPIKSHKFGHAPDPSTIYISEAWINRGSYGQEPEFRARGRTNMLRPPYTGISVVLKEEKTRIRQKAEKEAKALRKRLSGKTLWVQLPDRKVTAQRQHLLW
ncbi:hypothetical protein B0A52_00696 [Exophiala mesophila]|uniref:Ribosomal protein L22 n=1 Tax=Exophiala mesophila TaxID=212818 RepID=A0A438NHZ2_EXOME|nr:hypothetical protein B0A52_00696 [Exophiala mesophila]